MKFSRSDDSFLNSLKHRQLDTSTWRPAKHLAVDGLLGPAHEFDPECADQARHDIEPIWADPEVRL